MNYLYIQRPQILYNCVEKRCHYIRLITWHDKIMYIDHVDRSTTDYTEQFRVFFFIDIKREVRGTWLSKTSIRHFPFFYSLACSQHSFHQFSRNTIWQHAERQSRRPAASSDFMRMHVIDSIVQLMDPGENRHKKTLFSRCS